MTNISGQVPLVKVKQMVLNDGDKIQAKFVFFAIAIACCVCSFKDMYI